MLQQMRNVARSWVATIFMGGIALSFALWGIGDVLRGGSNDTNVATVGSRAIPVEEYQRDYKNMIKNAQTRFGELSPDQIKKLNIADRALQSLINEAAENDLADRLGLTVGDAQVTTAIRNNPAFIGPLGTFDRNTFLRVLNAYEYSEPAFVAYLRDGARRDQILSAARDGFEVPAGFGRALFAYLNERRAVQYITVPDTAIAPIPAPTDAQLKAFIADHKTAFSIPAYRAITYGEIGVDDVAPQMTVSDLQIQQEYDRRKKDPSFGYDIPEKRTVEQLNFPNDAAAKAARAKLDSGTSFADLAKSLKTAPIDLGEVTAESLGDRGAATFALPLDGVTQPLKNLSGYVLLHVTKIEPGSQKKLADVQDDIRKDLVNKLAVDRIANMADAYTEANSGGLSLSAAAKKVGMHVVHIPAVDANGLAPDGSKAPIPADADFRAQMNGAEIGQEGDPFQTKDGHEYVIDVDSETPSRLKPFGQVREQAAAMWTAEQKNKALAAKAQALAAQATKDNSLDGVAKSLGVTPKSSEALERDKPSGDLPASLIAKIFAAPPGSSVGGAVAKDDTYIVARVTGVRHPPAPVGNPEYEKFIGQVSAGTADDIATSLALAARDKNGVTINQKLVDQTTSSGNEGS
ncbi:MAG: SurA N-terminal domain-containing protein [Rhizomicrobium sp.]